MRFTVAEELVAVKRALVSVSDKSGLEDFARSLSGEFGVELISTGGTARFLRDAGLEVKDVSAVTGFPEMMDGRVKTLHPKIHGALLGQRDHPEHLEAMRREGIKPIDLVCINLYPFEQTVARKDASVEEAIENIDIGGPAMIRSAAKNHRWVVVVTSPEEYGAVVEELRGHGGRCTPEHRRRQALRAFERTARYDAAIAGYLGLGDSGSGLEEQMPEEIRLMLRRKQLLRYGENPHQKGALYVDRKPAEASVAWAEQLHGKDLSYVNLLDADGALGAVKEFDEPAACIVKHTTPCGCAVGADAAEAFRRAYEGDPLAAFGGIVALNRAVDAGAAKAITGIDKLLEVIVAPSFEDEALELLRERWKNVRLLAVGPMEKFDRGEAGMHRIAGGYLVQERNLRGREDSQWKVVSKRQPTDGEMRDLRFAWLVCKHVKSNAVVVAKGGMLLGAGAGQMDRVASARLAVEKAGGRVAGSVAASDAFFPFADGPRLLLEAGVKAIIQPGGSLRDQETIDAVDEAGAAMVVTGERHFKH